MLDLDHLVECIEQLGIIDLDSELIDWDENDPSYQVWLHGFDKIKYLKERIEPLLTDLSQGNTEFFTYQDTELIYCLMLVNDKGFNFDIGLMNNYLIAKLKTAKHIKKRGRKAKDKVVKDEAGKPVHFSFRMDDDIFIEICKHYNPNDDIDIKRWIYTINKTTKKDYTTLVKYLDFELNFEITKNVRYELSTPLDMTADSYSRKALEGKHKLQKLQIPSFYPKK